MDNLTFSKIKESLDKYNNIAIVTRRDPSVDEMSGALSLYLAIRSLGKNVTVATPNDPLVEVSSLVGIDEVKTNLGSSSGDLMMYLPYKEGEIDKVTSAVEGNYLKLIVKAGELGINFDEKDIRFERGAEAPELLFIVGSPRVSDLGRLFDTEMLKDTVIVNIDNKPDNQGFGDILMVSTRLSSLSEVIANLILSIGLKMDLDIAQNLMTGLAVSTNNFQSENTSPLAFEMAGILLRQGAIRPQGGAASERRKLINDYSNELSQVPQMQQSGQHTGSQLRPSQRPLQRQIQQTQRPQQRPQANVSQVSSQSKPVSQSEKVKKVEVKTAPDDFDFEEEDNTLQTPPDEWLEPKIYKGSTNF
jgi:nanoRNase/pAp phosphatase (c-di-AMP/oligoRNAs hydrolase)